MIQGIGAFRYMAKFFIPDKMLKNDYAIFFKIWRNHSFMKHLCKFTT